MSWISRAFGKGAEQPKQAQKLIGEITGMVDNLFTSDAERKVLQTKLEALAAANPHAFIAGGRSAIMWCLALAVLYNVAIREILILFLGVQNPPAPLVDTQELITHVFKLLAGSL